MSSPDVHSLIGAFVLDALTPDERAVFEQHMTECAFCAEEVDTLQVAVSDLSHLAEEPAPAELRSSVLAGIQQLPQTADAPAAAELPAARPGPRHNAAHAAHSAPRSRGPRPWQLATAACALIALVLAAWGYQQHRDARRATQASAAQIQQVLRAPDTAVVSGPVGTGRATVVYSRQADRLVLIGRGIPSPPAGKTYQLWMISGDGKTITSAGVFAPDANGNVLHSVSSLVPGTQTMGVSIEPAGGSAQPTDVIATVHL